MSREDTRDRTTSSGPLRSGPLPPAIGRYADWFFGVELGDVRLHLDARPRALGAVAFATDRRIHLDPRLTRCPAHVQWHVLGHELAHLAQQRRGQSGSHAGVDACRPVDWGDLEREAEDLGRRFARGGPRARTVGVARPGPAPVIQCLVSVAGSVLPTGADVPRVGLSEKAYTVLSLLDHGTAWLETAVTSTDHFAFASEMDLVDGVQIGMNGHPLALLAGIGLLVRPAKLMEMTEAELNHLLVCRENGDGVSPVDESAAVSILDAHGLRRAESLRVVPDLLKRLDVRARPVFQVLSLGDALALLGLTAVDTKVRANRALQKESARFAVEHATTPGQFVSYYRFYQALVEKLSGAASGERPRRARTALATLRPLVLDHLRCPEPRWTTSPAAVTSHLHGWLARGHSLGFADVATGLREIMIGSTVATETGDEARTLVTELVGDATRLVQATVPTRGALTQDGERYQVDYDGDRATARISVDRQGCMTLARFRRRTAPDPGASDTTDPVVGASGTT